MSVQSDLKQYRAKHGLTVRQLAKRLDLSPAMVTRLELGQRYPSLSVMVKLSALLERPLNTMLTAGDKADQQMKLLYRQWLHEVFLPGNPNIASVLSDGFARFLSAGK